MSFILCGEFYRNFKKAVDLEVQPTAIDEEKVIPGR